MPHALLLLFEDARCHSLLYLRWQLSSGRGVSGCCPQKQLALPLSAGCNRNCVHRRLPLTSCASSPAHVQWKSQSIYKAAHTQSCRWDGRALCHLAVRWRPTALAHSLTARLLQHEHRAPFPTCAFRSSTVRYSRRFEFSPRSTSQLWMNAFSYSVAASCRRSASRRSARARARAASSARLCSGVFLLANNSALSAISSASSLSASCWRRALRSASARAFSAARRVFTMLFRIFFVVRASKFATAAIFASSCEQTVWDVAHVQGKC